MRLERSADPSEDMYSILWRQVNDALLLLEDGLIIEANRQAAALVGRPLSEIVGRRAADFVPVARPADFVLARPDGSTVEAAASESIVDVRGRKLTVVLLRDVSDKRNAERRAAAQLEVTQVLARSRTLSEAAPRLLEAICTTLRWDKGTLWQGGGETETLGCLARWPGSPGETHRPGASDAFESDAGMVRSVWESREATWGPAAVCNTGIPGSGVAPNEGPCARVFFPIVSDGEIYGVIEMCRRQILQPDAGLLQKLSSMGSQIGQFLARRRAEEELRKASVYARSLIEASLDPLVTISPDGKITDVNAATEAATGLRRAELKGTDFSDYFTEPERAREGYQQVLADGEVRDFPLTIRHVSGRATDVLYNASVFRDEAGHVQGVFAAARDVSELKRAGEALRESEAELKEAQRVAHVGSWNWVMETDTVTWSDEIFRIAGREPASGSPSLGEQATLYTPESLARLQPLVERAMRTGEPYEAELEVIRPDGTTRWISAAAEVRRDARGRIVGLRGTSQDITEQRRLQEQFLQAQKLEAVGRLAGGIAHDFNNNLTVIGGYDEMLLRTLPEGDPAHRQATEIGLATGRAAALTRQLLTFSRRQVLEPKVVDLNGIVNGVHGLLGRLVGEDVEIVLKLQSGTGLVKVDPGQIEQVIMNLAVNARDAMPQGGKLILETRDVELDESNRRANLSVAPGPYVLLAASDTGCGMTPEIVSRIFEPFFTTKEQGKGTGLGLSTVFGIAKQSGGDVSVTSVPGEGSTFKIFLPRVSAEIGERDLVPSPEILRALPGETVLVVEDDEAVRRLTESMLSDLGYEVLSARRGEEALEISAQHPRPIDLLLTDIVMPGMRGPEVAKRLLALRPETRVVFMSGYAAEALLHQLADLSRVALLQKPFGSSKLARKLREAFDAGRPGERRGASVHEGPKKVSILHMDDDKDILELTRMLLGGEGHRVASCLDVDETVGRYAEALARGERFDLVLLDLSIPGKKGGVEGMREILALDPTARIVACSGAGPSESGPLESGFLAFVEKPFTCESLKAILPLL